MSADNEPAFPRDHAHLGHNGMTLRDYFAAKALPLAIEHWRQLDAHEDDGGKFVWNTESSSDDCMGAAELAYSMADAMLNARSFTGSDA